MINKTSHAHLPSDIPSRFLTVEFIEEFRLFAKSLILVPIDLNRSNFSAASSGTAVAPTEKYRLDDEER